MKLAAYILTTESIDERRANARELASSLHEFEAIDCIEIVPSVFWRDAGAIEDCLQANPGVRFTQKYLAQCRKGQIGATLSHITMWKKLLQSDNDGVLIFEDDIFVSEPGAFREILAELPEQPNIEFLRIHLHKRFRDEILAINSPARFVEDPSRWGFAAYFINRSGAEKLLKRFRRIEYNIDLIIPLMAKAGKLSSRTVKEVVVEHHPFDGSQSDLLERHEQEVRKYKLQKSASTIWTSPVLFEDEPMHGNLSGMADDLVPQLKTNGHATLKGVFDAETVAGFRTLIQQNLHLFKNTRPTGSSLHLAGFHRFPELEPLHSQLTGSKPIRRFLHHVLGGEPVQSIGLSDITINRSQCWHKDLLRGKFRTFLEDRELCWGENGGGVYKVLFYLQPGSSLRVIRGSHLQPIPLESDVSSEPDEHSVVESIPVEPGDVVIMDIRMSHRGASEDVYASGKFDENPNMLVSTALGSVKRPLTRAMEVGNFHRLVDWMERNP